MKHAILIGLSALTLSAIASPTMAIDQSTQIEQATANPQAANKQVDRNEQERQEAIDELNQMFEQERQEMMTEMNARLEKMHQEMMRIFNERFQKAQEQRLNR